MKDDVKRVVDNVRVATKLVIDIIKNENFPNAIKLQHLIISIANMKESIELYELFLSATKDCLKQLENLKRKIE